MSETYVAFSTDDPAISKALLELSKHQERSVNLSTEDVIRETWGDVKVSEGSSLDRAARYVRRAGHEEPTQSPRVQVTGILGEGQMHLSVDGNETSYSLRKTHTLSEVFAGDSHSNMTMKKIGEVSFVAKEFTEHGTCIFPQTEHFRELGAIPSAAMDRGNASKAVKTEAKDLLLKGVKAIKTVNKTKPGVVSVGEMKAISVVNEAPQWVAPRSSKSDGVEYKTNASNKESYSFTQHIRNRYDSFTPN